MKLNILTLIFLTILQLACASKRSERQKEKHIIYLHGRIIEIQGKDAFSEDFGKYEINNILSAIKVKNSTVHCKIRTENVDVMEYAKLVSDNIDSLISGGVEPIDITVIGASKGAIIASNVSALNTSPINYVFLAGNNEYQENNNDWKFHGQVLCIYDLSDEIAGHNYNYWEDRENYTTKFEQLEITTNLGHGFLYKALPEWIMPVQKWILTQSLE